MVCVFILWMTVVPAPPSACDAIVADGANRLPPELEVLDRAARSAPPTPRPSMHPLGHPRDQVFRVAGEHGIEHLALRTESAKCLDHRAERHPVIGRPRLGDP